MTGGALNQRGHGGAGRGRGRGGLGGGPGKGGLRALRSPMVVSVTVDDILVDRVFHGIVQLCATH